MKKLFLTVIFVIYIIVGNAQINTTAMGTQQEITANETLTWSANVELNVRQLVTVAFQITTVNTSNLEANFYIDKSATATYWQPAVTFEDYTFTHTAGETGTILMFDIEDWNYKYIRARVTASGDAQSINITPYYKTTKGYR
jgi:hypothetical protein